MKTILPTVVTRLRVLMFPTEHDKEVRRWWSDGGDDKFRYDYPLDSDSLVIDLGGYKGQWASDIYARYNCRVLVFEPVRSFADDIERRFRQNPRIEVFCLALGNTRRQETIRVAGDRSSLYGTFHDRQTIQVEDAAAFVAEHNIREIDLMKMNIEGGEYELLPRLIETGIIRRIRHLQVQFHDVGPDAERCMETLGEALARTHRCTCRYKFVWETWISLDA
jgi:FkbM family methyltransferase